MRRPGPYGDTVGNAYVTAQMQHMSGQRMEHKSGHFQGRQEHLTSEKEHPYGSSKVDGQWRWERDGSKGPSAMSPNLYNEGEGNAPRSYYNQRDPRMSLEIQGNSDPRSQPREGDMDIGYKDNFILETFEGLEQKFLDDVMKLSKEETDAEDAENARHREKINAINAQYEEQLAALRARHANRRDELLRRESHARQLQYQQAAVDHIPNSNIGPTDPQRYGGVASAPGEPHRADNADNYDAYRERARFIGGSRDHGFEPRGHYPGGRVYDTRSRYY